MKANELRIGNYLQQKSEHMNDMYPFGHWKVTKIGVKSFQCKGFNSICFEPIKITDEWLLKFGFIKDKDRESWYVDIENGYNKFDLMWFNQMYLKSRYQGEDLYTQAIPYIKYVHQLQNLYFALTGEELTI